MLIAAGSAGAQGITLPIEVIGAAPKVASVDLGDVDLRSAEVLKLRVHGLRYQGQAVVRINEGEWVRLRDEHIVYPDNQYGGIGGGYHTLRFEIPMEELSPSVVQGPTTISFCFHAGTKPVSGYRVIGLNFFGTDGGGLFTEADFAYDDPGNWTAPIDGQNAIDAGRQLFLNASIKDGLDQTAILATCSDCHAKNGEDLEYFAYSNHSIIERAKFHGLNEHEGKQIASYIRSLSASGEVAGRLGRPYDPPYQPGKRLLGKSVEYWAAGAGLEAVKDYELETLQTIFPQGTSREEIRKVIDRDASLDITKIPVAMQFPDWNSWLPEHHPKDIWAADDYWNEHRVSFYADWYAGELASKTEETFGHTGFLERVGYIQDGARAFLAQGRYDTKGSSQWRTKGSETTDRIPEKYLNHGAVEGAKVQLAKWVAVRYWDMFHTNGLEDRAGELIPGADEWQWPTDRQSVHQVAPHIVADNRNNFRAQHKVAGDYESSAWYQLQMTLNSGQGHGERDEQPAQTPSTAIQPVDWPYQMIHIYETADSTERRRYEAARYYLSVIKMLQVLSNGQGPTQEGWQLRSVHPAVFTVMPSGGTDFGDQLNHMDGGLAGRLQDELLKSWLDEVENYRAADWTRETPTTAKSDLWYQIDPVDAVPSASIPFYDDAGYFWRYSEMNHMDLMWRLIPELDDRKGISCTTVRRLSNWAEQMWPRGDWAQQMSDPDCAERNEEGTSTAADLTDDAARIFPNPGNGSFQLSVPQHLAGRTLRVEVLDLTGRRVVAQPLAAQQVHHFDVSERITPGSYVVSVLGVQGEVVLRERMVVR